MNFCDKLQKIRKENNITQEQLADKLNVSRQAVSKWESGSAYPDTEKLIQISKLFKVSLDELINDNANVNKVVFKKKFNFMETFDLIFETIRKVWNMFFAMKFWEKVKFILEMAFAALAIYLAAALINNIILGIIRRIFIFLPVKAYNVIDYIIYTILYIAWIIIGVMFFLKILKVRYLDYYVIISDDTIDKPIVEEPIRELKEKKDTKIVIRDPADSSLSIFKGISKVLVFLFKCICVFILIPIVMAFIAFVILLVISLAYLFSGIFFNGITLGILGIIFFIFLLINFLYRVIFNQKINYTRMFIIFITSVSLMGIGIGISFASLSSFTTYDDNIWEQKTTSLTIPMTDKLTNFDIAQANNEMIVIDNNRTDIKIDVISDEVNEPYISNNHISYNYHDGVEDAVEIAGIFVDSDELAIMKRTLNDLKHKKINTGNLYNTDYKVEKIYISESNLTKIKENFNKLS